jgi:hypothetical protein
MMTPEEMDSNTQKAAELIRLACLGGIEQFAPELESLCKYEDD